MIIIANQRLLHKPKHMNTKISIARFLINLIIPILMAKTLIPQERSHGVIAIQILLSLKKAKVIHQRNLMKRK